MNQLSSLREAGVSVQPQTSPSESFLSTQGPDSFVPADQFQRTCLVLRDFLLLLVGIFFIYQLGPLFSSDLMRDATNVVGPVLLILGSSLAFYRLLLVYPLMIWTPIPWFLLNCAVFYGMGPLAYVFGTEHMITYMNSFWPVDDAGLLRSNVLNTVGIFVVTFVVFAGLQLRRSRPNGLNRRPLPADEYSSAKLALFLFLLVGLPVKYLFVLPNEFGQTEFFLPGAIISLEAFVFLGLLMLSYLSARWGKGWTGPLVTLIIIQLSVDFLRFYKAHVLLNIMMVGLGRYLGNQRIKDLGICFLILIGTYLLLCPVIVAGRKVITQRSGTFFFGAPLEARVEAIIPAIYALGEAETDGWGDSEGVWWTRISYTNAQVFAMHLYDTGAQGDSLSMALWVCIPRFLWPDKPDSSAASFEFTELALGQAVESATGAGVFAECYWNGGWAPVVLICFYVGAVYTFLAKMALKIMHQRSWLLLPCVFYGIKLAFGVGGFFAVEFVAGVIMILAYFSALSVLPMSIARPTH